MKLTEQQKKKTSDYIFEEQKYRETYNELYDHIITALSYCDEVYSLESVAKIVNKDFGGFENIRKTEEEYQKELNKRYIRAFRQEMLNTFKWPGLLNNISTFSFCTILYFASRNHAFNSKSILGGILLCFLVVALFGFYKIISNRLKFSKYSILDNYLGGICSLGIALMNVFLYLFIRNDSLFDLGGNFKLICTFILFFLCSIYVRSFIKFYNKKLKILTA